MEPSWGRLCFAEEMSVECAAMSKIGSCVYLSRQRLCVGCISFLHMLTFANMRGAARFCKTSLSRAEYVTYVQYPMGVYDEYA